MTKIFRFTLAAAAPLVLYVTVSAQTPALDVKMGLWEISSTTEIGGQMPDIDTSKMTPEQKARMEQAMKAMMGSHTNVTKSCVTKEKFDTSKFMGGNEVGQTCKQTITTNTRSTLDASVVCTGENAMTSQMHIDALSSTAFKGTAKGTGTNQGRTMTVSVNMTGKWLGADCGDTK
jgi:hypothetical protein